MKKRGISVAAVLIACTFIVTIVVFAVGIYTDYSEGSKSAAARFDKLSAQTTETSEYFQAGSKDFLKTFNAIVGAPEIYEQIHLVVDGIEVYTYPMESVKASSFFVKSFSTAIIGGDGAKITLAANIYALSPSVIFERAKIAFIVILAATLLACVLLMYLYLSESESKKELEEPLFVDDELAEDEDFTESEELSEEDELPQEDVSLEIDLPEGEVLEEEEETTKEVPVEKEPSEVDKVDFAALENAYNEHISPQNEQGLFSPTSGFGWESYLDTRLESELARATSNEQDLSIIAIKIPNLKSDSEYYGKICQKLLDFFQFKDYIFEYKEDGFAAILQNKDVDSTMELAEALYAEINSILKKAGKTEKPLMGITSRSLRIISAARLKSEADQALLHAQEEPDSPIIAFRVNPEKYRKHLSQPQD